VTKHADDLMPIFMCFSSFKEQLIWSLNGTAMHLAEK